MLKGIRTRAYIGGHSRAQKVAERSSGGSECNALSASAGVFAKYDDIVNDAQPKDEQQTTIARSDASVAIAAVENGYSKQMYYLAKHAGTELAFLHDLFFPTIRLPWLLLKKVPTDLNDSDPHTKPLDWPKLERAMIRWGLILIVEV